MHPFPDYATARFALCCSERDAPVVLSRQQSASLHPGRCKRDWSRRQEQSCRAMLIVPSLAEQVVFRAQPNFAQRFVGAPVDVPW